jgi:potassium efflux system protein
LRPGRYRLALLLYLAAAAVWATAPADSGSPSGLSTAVVESRIQEVQASSDYDDKLKATLNELYHKVLTNLEAAQSSSDSAKLFSQARTSAPAEAQRERAALDAAERKRQPATVDVTAQTPLDVVEQLLLKEKANYAAVDAKLTAQLELLSQESTRPEQARQRLGEATLQLDNLNAGLKQPALPDEPAILTEARRWSQQAQIKALNAEIDMLDQELLSQPMRVELIKARRDTTRRSLRRIGERVKLLETALNEKRRDQVEAARKEVVSAQGETRDKPRVVQDFAAGNAALSEQLSRLTAQLEQVASGGQITSDRVKLVEDEFRSTQQKLDLAGLSQALSQILLEQRRLLPDVREIRKGARLREQQIAEVALEQIQNNEELRNLQNLDEYVDTLTAKLTPEAAESVRADLLELARTRSNLLEKLVATSESDLRALGELDYAQNRLLAAVTAYDNFLAERLLWVRSAPAPSLALVLHTPAQVIELLSPTRWLGAVRTLQAQLLGSPLPIAVLLIAGALLVRKRAMARALRETGKKIIKVRTDRFRYTLEALALTLLIATPWPLLLWTAGWMLSGSLDASVFDRALARALMVLSPAFFYLSAFRSLCRPSGLAIAHFRWPETTTRALRTQIGILMTVFLPAALVAVVSIRDTSLTDGALARFAFIVAISALSWFFYRLFGPRKPILAELFERNPGGLLARLRYLWLSLAMVIPVLLIVLAVSGFLYTAGILTGSLIHTLWLVLGFLVIHQAGVRWLMLIRNKLAFEATVERRRAALAEQRDAGTRPDAAAREETELEPAEIDLTSLNQQSLKLLNSAIVFSAIIGMWFIWNDVLPAFGRLDHMTLWHYTGIVNGEQSQVAVTVADILLALLITVVTVIGTRRFPALLEIVLLKRESVTPGGRYAAATLARYVIVAVGSVLVLNALGARWQQVQWLVAALGVGIGFGLQEIVANFISGLIILFERPIRVGDVVTVGDSDGVVTRIQIRATTIRTWDRQELLVPNKEFITSRLLNWSLSDPITRIRIVVGVAYGSDINQAMTLMREAGERNPLTLAEPPPYVLFTQFGDNTLNLELRCFVGSMDDRMPAISQLNLAINDVFNEHGISIAFPQRDVHLDTSRPLDIRIHPQA